MGERRHFHKTPEQLAEIEERRQKLNRLIFEAGGTVKYAEIVNVSKGTLGKMVSGEAVPSDRALGLEPLSSRFEVTGLWK